MSFFNKDECKKFYDLKKTLGTGSFATVKLGINKKDKTQWAIKCIDTKSLIAQEDKDALETEVEILQQVSHPNIIKLKEVFDTKKVFYMVLEVCAGGELFDRIVEKEKYTESEAADVVGKVASALHYCHSRDIVHRDLKPENLLLTSAEDDADVKIADFGLAKLLKEETLMQTACGTPGYVAPEILEVQDYDNKVDSWSLGVITYILLCGFPPFYDENNAQLFQAIKRGDYSFPSPYWDDVSQEAKDLIGRLLTVAPGDRISCGDVLQDPWVLNKSTNTHEITSAKDNIKKFNARRKFQAGIQKVRMINALRIKS